MAIYRDNSKRVQPLSSGIGQGREEAQRGHGAAGRAAPVEKIVYRPVRRKLPDERRSITHKFSIGGHEGYITVGHVRRRSAGRDLHHHGEGRLDHFRPDGQLRHGGQLQPAVRRAAEVPGGQVQPRALRAERVDGQSAVPYAKSIMDYIFRWLGAKFLGPEYAVRRRARRRDAAADGARSAADAAVRRRRSADAPLCAECGSIMTRNGSCYKCGNCGGTSGCS